VILLGSTAKAHSPPPLACLSFGGNGLFWSYASGCSYENMRNQEKT